MNTLSSPLSGRLSDDQVAVERYAEKARELVNAYERINELEDALRGLIGLTQLIAGRDDVTPDVREVLTTNHRLIDAKELLK